MEIKLLSNEQEAAILNLIADKYQCKDNGASRMVFLVDTKDLIQIGLKLFENYKYVVKVSIGIAGINQSRIEASAFERFGASGEYPLASIPYIGHYVEIMDRVKPLCLARDYACDDEDDFIDAMLEEYDYSEDDCRVMYNVIQMLHEINGYTSDNGQIGFSCNDGSIVAYDYGYEADSDDELCSDLHDYFDIYNTESLAEYLHALVKILDEEEDAMLALEESYGVHRDNNDNCSQTYDEEDSYENTNEENSRTNRLYTLYQSNQNLGFYRCDWGTLEYLVYTTSSITDYATTYAAAISPIEAYTIALDKNYNFIEKTLDKT